MKKQSARSAFLPAPTFTQWLHHVRSHAKWATLYAWVEHDRNCWPLRARTLASFLRHLADYHQAHPLIRPAPTEADIRMAFAAYERALERGTQVPRRMGPAPIPAGQRRKLQSFSLAPGTPDRIARLKADFKVGSGGHVIDRLIDEAWAKRR